MESTTLKTLFDSGTLLVPTRGRGQYIVPYAHWRESPPTWEAYLHTWESHPGAFPEILCGSGNIVVIDVDEKNKPGAVEIFEAEMEACLPETFERLYVEKTGSGGRHYIFRSDDMESENVAFAAAPQSLEELAEGKTKYLPFVEYKGNKSLCRVFPGEGIAQIRGSLLGLPWVSANEAKYIKYVASLLNEKPEQEQHVFAQPATSKSVTADTPGNDYSSRVDIADFVAMLERHGWAVVKASGYRGRVTLRRPGARTKGIDADILNRVFACRSASVSEFEPHKGYSFFSVYGILEHNGDFKAASKALRAAGWGRTVEFGQQASPAGSTGEDRAEDGQEGQNEHDALWDEIWAKSLELDSSVKETYSVYFTDKQGWELKRYGLLEHGHLCVVGGREKSRKTTLITAIVASMLADGSMRCGFTANTWGNILWIDTEQPTTYARATKRRILTQAMLESSDRLFYMPLVDFVSQEDKLKAIEKCFERISDISVVVIDGVIDITPDFMDAQKSMSTVLKIMSWCRPKDAPQRMVFAVIHMNKADRELRGHAGTILGQKGDLVLNVVLNESTDDSDVKFARARGIRPPAFSFYTIKDNIPAIIDYPMPPYPWLEEGYQKMSDGDDKNFPTEAPPEAPEFKPLDVPRGNIDDLTF